MHYFEIKDGASVYWESVGFDGPVPPVRESHSSVTWGNRMVVYGGMNGHRLGDVWLLDIDPWKWTSITTQGIVPLPRSLHVASIIKNRYICTLYVGV